MRFFRSRRVAAPPAEGSPAAPVPGADAPRPRSRLLLAVAIAAGAVLLAGVIPSPYVIERPGPTVDVLGSIEIEKGEPRPVIEIDDVDVFEDEGSLRLLTVSISGSREHPKSWLSLLPGLVDPAQQILPVDEVYPEGESEEERTEYNAALMEDSQEKAAAAAFEYLGNQVPVTLTVAGVADGSPSDGVLQEGDVILAVGDLSDVSYAQLREEIARNGAGTPLKIAVERDGERVDLDITPELPEGGEEPMIGAVLQTDYDLPHEVDIALADIGGPSAGLVFTLGLIERLTPDSLLDGQQVAGTGTINASGQVGAIGGLEQKMWAASRAGSELFLMPLANCADLPEEIPGDLHVAPVATLEEAVAAIEASAAGEEPRGVEACTAG